MTFKEWLKSKGLGEAATMSGAGAGGVSDTGSVANYSLPIGGSTGPYKRMAPQPIVTGPDGKEKKKKGPNDGVPGGKGVRPMRKDIPDLE